MLENMALNKDVYKNGLILFSFEQSKDDVTSGHFTKHNSCQSVDPSVRIKVLVSLFVINYSSQMH
jgi:hypothetical protein